MKKAILTVLFFFTLSIITVPVSADSRTVPQSGAVTFDLSNYAEVSYPGNVSGTLLYNCPLGGSISYDLDIAVSGTYKITLRASSSSKTSPVRVAVMRKGTYKTAQEGAGDIKLADNLVPPSESYSDWHYIDFGNISLSAGTKRLSFLNIDSDYGTVYYNSFTIERVGSYGDAPIDVTVRDMSEAKNSSGEDLAVYAAGTYPNLYSKPNPFISFPYGGYAKFEVDIVKGGRYRLVQFSGQGSTLSMKIDVDDTTVYEAAEITANTGTTSVMSPYEIGYLNLTAGHHTLKLTNNGAAYHFSFFTLQYEGEMADGLPIKRMGKTSIEAKRTGENTDFGYYGGQTRTYEIYFEEAGEYIASLDYATTGQPLFTLSVGDENTLSGTLEATGSYATRLEAEIGTIHAEKGSTRLSITVNGVMNFYNIFFARVTHALIEAETAQDAALIAENGGESARLSKGSAVSYSFESAAATSCDLWVWASTDFTEKTLNININGETTEKVISGSQFGEFKMISLGSFSVPAGSVTLSLTNSAGRDIDIDFIVLISDGFIKKTIEESSESYDKATGSADRIYTIGGSTFIIFNPGDYQVFDIYAPYTGSYELTVYCGSGGTNVPEVSVYVQNGSDYDFILNGKITINGNMTALSPSVAGTVNLERGYSKIKLLQTNATIHLGYITLKCVGDKYEEIAADILNPLSSTAAVDSENGYVTFASPQKEILELDVPKSGCYEISSKIAANKDTQISIIKDDGEVCAALLTGSNSLTNFSAVNIGRINLTSGTNTIILQHSGTTNTSFRISELKLKSISPVKSVDIIDGENYIAAKSLLNGRKYSLAEDSVTIEKNGFVSYDMSLAEGGFFLLSFDESISGAAIAANELPVGYAEDKYLIINLESGSYRFDIGSEEDPITFSGFYLTYLGEFLSQLEETLIESINNAQGSDAIREIISEYADILNIDVSQAESGIFYKKSIYDRMAGQKYQNVSALINDFYRICESEKTAPTVALAKNNVPAYEFDSGDFSLTIDTSRIKDAAKAVAAVYKDGQMTTLDGGACGAENTSLRLSLNGVEEGSTLKIIYIDDFENIVPINGFPESYREIYVSSEAAEDGDGSFDNPYATLDDALGYIADTSYYMTGNITVNVMPGTYEISEPLNISGIHSGRNGNKVVIRGMSAEDKPKISGARHIDGWQPWQGGIYRAPFTDADYVRDLYVAGFPAVRARSEWVFKCGEMTGNTVAVSAEHFPELYSAPENLELVWELMWTTQRTPVTSLSIQNDTVSIGLKSETLARNSEISSIRIESGKNFYLENALELLDKPGEFYFDKTDGYMYYYPVNIDELNNIYVPAAEGLVNICGDSAANPAANISFENLEFFGGAWTEASAYGMIATQADSVANIKDGGDMAIPAQFTVENAENITITDCVFRCMGSSAVALEDSVSNACINGNIFCDIAGTGVRVGHWRHSSDISKRCRNVNITNNVFRRCAYQYRSCVAVSVYYEKSVNISHNLIKQLPYTGISGGWGWGLADPEGWGNISVNHNIITDVMQLLDDGGGVYFLGPNRNSEISYNVFDNIKGISSALYTDSGAAFTKMHHNVIENSRQWLTIANISLHDIRLYDNFTNTTRGLITSNEFTEKNTTVTDGTLPEAAQAIKAAAGPGSKYAHLSQNLDMPQGRISTADNTPKKTYVVGDIYEAEDCLSYTSGIVYGNNYLGINATASALFSVNAPQSGNYVLHLYAAKPASETNSVLQIIVGENAVATAEIESTGSYQDFKFFDSGEFYLPAGTSQIRIKSIRGSLHMDCFALEYIG